MNEVAASGRRTPVLWYFDDPMPFSLWFVLIIITGFCFIGLVMILRGARRESKLRRRKASVRKWVQSETVARPLRFRKDGG